MKQLGDAENLATVVQAQRAIGVVALRDRTGAFDFAHYRDTHRRIFSDVYE